jgi:hypothetical protein
MGEGAVRRFLLLGLPGAGLFGLIAIAVLLRSRSSTADLPAPAKVSRPARTFHETLDGSRYQNQDLGVSVTGPDGWAAALGDRSQDRQPYEGLVVRMTPKAVAEPGQLQPFVTVIKRTLSASAPRDPLAYIAREVLTPEKFVTDAPTVVSLSGRRVGKVGFEVKSGTTSLKVLQVVHLVKDEAIILTATAPTGSFAEWREKFEKVFESLKLES